MQFELYFPLLFSYHSPNYQVCTTFNLALMGQEGLATKAVK